MSYTQEEMDFLRDNYRDMGARECADRLGKKTGSVYDKARQMGLVAKERWTDEETDFLVRHYPTKSRKWVALMLGKTVRSVQNKANYIGVKRQWMWTDEEKRELVRLVESGVQDYNIARKLGRTTGAVKQMRWKLGVKR